MPADRPRKAAPGKAVRAKAAARPCPICGKPSSPKSRPFCSERCRSVDLNRWLSGSYAIPGRNDEDNDAE